MQTFQNTICLNCGQVALVAPGFCITCGHDFPAVLPALMTRFEKRQEECIEYSKAA